MAKQDDEYALKFRAQIERAKDFANRQNDSRVDLCGRGNMTTGSSQTPGMPDIGDIEVVEHLVEEFVDYKEHLCDKLEQILNLMTDLQNEYEQNVFDKHTSKGFLLQPFSTISEMLKVDRATIIQQIDSDLKKWKEKLNEL